MNVRYYNRTAWDKAVERRSQWTVPVSSAAIDVARQGDWSILLTPTKPVPRDWFPALAGCDLLGLAAGGGQQGPILAAAGANVTVFDNSPQQLAQDRLVAQRDGLQLRTVEGDMRDLSVFDDASFDLIVHPCSNLFVPDIRSIWQEAFRLLRPGGTLLSGFVNPTLYIFDAQKLDDGELVVRHPLPYSDLTSLTDEERQHYQDDLQPLEFGHTLEDQIGGQIAAGFAITGFYEDTWDNTPLDAYMPVYIATHAQKP